MFGGVMQLRDFGLLVVLGAIWGASYLFIRVAAPVLGALAVADLRVLLASAALLLYAWRIQQLPNLRSRWRQLLLLGAVNAAIPFTLIGNSTVLLNASM